MGKLKDIEVLKDDFKRLTDEIKAELEAIYPDEDVRLYWHESTKFVQWQILHDELALIDEEWLMNYLGL